MSYVGVEPWIVLSRNRDAKVRYIVVVSPESGVRNRMQTPLLDAEPGYLRPAEPD